MEVIISTSDTVAYTDILSHKTKWGKEIKVKETDTGQVGGHANNN
jgi:hypothetical protein